MAEPVDLTAALALAAAIDERAGAATPLAEAVRGLAAEVGCQRDARAAVERLHAEILARIDRERRYQQELDRLRAALLQVQTERDELVKRHIECERLGTALAEAAKNFASAAVVRGSFSPGSRLSAASASLASAVAGFDAHQWPDFDRPGAPVERPEGANEQENAEKGKS